MPGWPSPTWLLLALATLVVSATLTALSILYAHRHNLIDIPGRRRSHVLPTARGGGIGLVVAILACSVVIAMRSWSSIDRLDALALIAAIVFVALAGWIDDHRPLSARVRFLVHCLSAILVSGVPLLLVVDAAGTDTLLVWVAIPLAAGVLAIVWSINLHNFMDGIDGLLAMQALFVFATLALLFAHAGRSSEAARVGLFAVATLGFVPFNFPRARIFMGDVGSGVLGLLIAVAIGWQLQVPAIATTSGLIVVSCFVIDATVTLMSRVSRGRRWYSAHREHLYQWLVRSGYSHAQVVGVYLAWNLSVVTPVVVWINRDPGAIAMALPDGHLPVPSGMHAMLAVYVAGTLVWALGKRHCLMLAKRRTRGINVQ